jgi:hypothetical protein
VRKMIPEVEAQLQALSEKMENEKKQGDVHADHKAESDNGHWDDWCLTKFLEGVCFRYVAFPVSLSFFLLHTCLLTHFVLRCLGRRR